MAEPQEQHRQHATSPRLLRPIVARNRPGRQSQATPLSTASRPRRHLDRRTATTALVVHLVPNATRRTSWCAMGRLAAEDTIITDGPTAALALQQLVAVLPLAHAARHLLASGGAHPAPQCVTLHLGSGPWCLTAHVPTALTPPADLPAVMEMLPTLCATLRELAGRQSPTGPP